MKEGLSLKPKEHLNLNIKGAKPIMACIGSIEDYCSSGQVDILKESFEHSDDISNVDFKGDPDELYNKDFLVGGFKTYVLSPVDSKNKFSKEFFNCTVLVVSGIDKETGKNISFLTHQHPEEISNKGSEFTSYLKQRLNEIKKKCMPGTIDAIVVGGNYLSAEDFKKRHQYSTASTKELAQLVKKNLQNYLNSIKLLSTKVMETLDFEPVIINGAKESVGYDDIYYNNDERRVYFIREKVNEKIGSFTRSDIEEGKKEQNK